MGDDGDDDDDDDDDDGDGRIFPSHPGPIPMRSGTKYPVRSPHSDIYIYIYIYMPHLSNPRTCQGSI